MKSTKYLSFNDDTIKQQELNSLQSTPLSFINTNQIIQKDNELDKEIVIINNQTKMVLPKQTKYNSKIIYITLILLSTVLFGFYLQYRILKKQQKLVSHQNNQQKIESISKQDENIIVNPVTSQNIQIGVVPPILQNKIINVDIQQLRYVWVLLQNQQNALNVEDIFFLNLIQKKVSESGLQFQKIYLKNVYDKLSKNKIQLITKAVHRRKFYFSLSQLLGLALLIEHGGILIDLNKVFLTDNLKWTLEILEGKQLPQGHPQIKFPENGKPEVFLPFSKRQNRFKTYFIVAKAGSQFLQNIFMEMVAFVQKKVQPYQDIVPAMIHNSRINVDIIFQFFQSLLFVKMKVAEIQRLKFNKASLMLPIAFIFIEQMNSYLINPSCQANEMNVISYPRPIVQNKCGKIYFMIFGLKDVMRNKLFQIIDSKDVSKIIKDSLLDELIHVEKNKQYWAPSNAKRDVFFCIIASQPSPLTEIQNHFLQIQNQKFKQWKVIYFTTQVIPAESSSKQNMKILNHTGNLGYNLQQAITKNCPMKSIVFLLQAEENLSSDNFLTAAAQKIRANNVFAASVDLQMGSGKIMINVQSLLKWPYGVNEFQNAIPQLKMILNGMRFFMSDYYRLIPRFDLRRAEGQFYEDFTVLLVEILNFGAFKSMPSGIAKFRAQKFCDMAFKFQKITGEFIKIKHIKQPSLKQAEYTQKKNPVESIWEMIRWAVEPKIDLKKVFVFNTGGDLPKPSEKQLIPQKIHQIWIEGPIPPIKLFISNQAKLMYPHYQYFLWTKENITRQNFPFTFDILQTLLQFQKNSPYSKYAMISDLMRQELMYHQGGFYFDFNFQVLKPVFDRWRRYKLVLGAQRSHLFRSYQAFCFFGTMPNNPVFLRLINYTNTNSINIYSNVADRQTGPFNFRQIINQTQENDPQILLMPFETVYPDSYSFKGRDKCIAASASIRPEQIGAEQNGTVLIKNCSSRYPMHNSIQHYAFGGSWVQRKFGK